MGADTENWERIRRHPYLRKLFPQPGKLWFNVMESSSGGAGGTMGIWKLFAWKGPVKLRWEDWKFFLFLSLLLLFVCVALKACFYISSNRWVQRSFLFSDVCTHLFGLRNNCVINVPGVWIAGKLILILCRDVQISLFFCFFIRWLVSEEHHTNTRACTRSSQRHTFTSIAYTHGYKQTWHTSPPPVRHTHTVDEPTCAHMNKYKHTPTS